MTRSLAQAREDAAADVEAAIGDLRIAFERYARLTTQLEHQHGRADLGPRLHTAIGMWLAHAGLEAFLAQVPPPLGGPPSLRNIVAKQHAQLT